MGFFQDLFGTSGDASKAAQQKVQGLQQAQAYADPYLAQGRQAITTGYGQAQDIFNPINATAQGGANAYADITGAAGQAGQDRARALFETDPGYQFARDEALRATERTQGTGGFQGSGNVLAALEDRASGLAQQQYGNYVNRLAPFLGYSLGAGASQAYTGEANALNTALGNQAQLGYGTQAGIGSAQAAGTLGDAAARQAGIGNILKIAGAVGGAALAPVTGGTSLAGTLLGFGGGGAGGNAVSNSDPYGLGNYNYNFGFG